MRISTLFVALLSGVLFGFGLSYSAMVKPEVVLAFLRFQDLGLLFVLGGAALVTGVVYYVLPRVLSKPWFGAAFGKHPSEMSRQTIGGAALFGVGWGLCGVCPGPAIAGLGVGNWPLLIALVGMFVGAYAHGFVASLKSSR
jgi:uncharacterized membrane protein YedE/YeeE